MASKTKSRSNAFSVKERKELGKHLSALSETKCADISHRSIDRVKESLHARYYTECSAALEDPKGEQHLLACVKRTSSKGPRVSQNCLIFLDTSKHRNSFCSTSYAVTRDSTRGNDNSTDFCNSSRNVSSVFCKSHLSLDREGVRISSRDLLIALRGVVPVAMFYASGATTWQLASKNSNSRPER